MAKMNFEPLDHTLLELQTTLETIEMLQEARKHKEPPRKRYKEYSEDISKNKKFKRSKKNGSDKYCEICGILGGNAKTHKTSNCFHKNKLKSMWNDKSRGGKSSFKRREVNAFVTRKATEIVKLQMKKHGFDMEESMKSENEE